MKILLYFSAYLVVALSFSSRVFAAPPEINCWALPGCDDGTWSASTASVYDTIWNLIRLLIEYVAVIAVIAVMIGWVMYLVSWGDEEKTKRAKSVIIWALVWVLVSVFAWSIINIVNKFTI